MCVTGLPRTVPDSAAGETRTRNLSLTSPALKPLDYRATQTTGGAEINALFTQTTTTSTDHITRQSRTSPLLGHVTSDVITETTQPCPNSWLPPSAVRCCRAWRAPLQPQYRLRRHRRRLYHKATSNSSRRKTTAALFRRRCSPSRRQIGSRQSRNDFRKYQRAVAQLSRSDLVHIHTHAMHCTLTAALF